MEDRITGPTGKAVRLETVDVADQKITVAWPDVDDAAEALNTEVMLWSKRSHAEMVYRRLLNTGTMKPRVPWARIVVATLATTAGFLWLPLWGALPVLALAGILLVVGWLTVAKNYSPMVRGKGGPDLIVNYLRKEHDADALNTVVRYLNEARKEQRAESVRQMMVALNADD